MSGELPFGPVQRSNEPVPVPSGWRAVGVALLLGLVAFLGFNANLRAVTAADTYAARYLPFSILENRTVVLNPILEKVAQGRRASMAQGLNRGATAFWIAKGEGDYHVSLYPILLPVAVTPLYLPAVAYLDGRGWDPHIFEQVARIMEKLCASLIAAASVALLYLLLRRRSPPGVALALSLVYAFGTTTWVISSQALWPHGLAQLLVVGAMLMLTGRATAPRIAFAGLLCGMIAANRPPDTVFAAALGLYGLWWAGRRAPLLVLGGLLPVVPTLAYNLFAVGHIAGAYALLARPSHYNDDLVGGVAGLLFSPTRGLFVFSPFLLFLPVFLLRTMRTRGTRVLDAAVAAALVAQIVGYALVDWRQGISWGPRWLTDGLPLMMWLLAPIVASLSRAGRALFGAACAVAVAIQAVGAFWYTGATDTAMFAAQHDDRMRPMWDWRNAPFVGELRHAPAPGDLLRFVQGNIDLIELTDVVVPDAAGRERIERHVDVAGWALADGRTPQGVAALAYGWEVAGSTAFFTRPDVVQALGIDSPAGWRLRFRADRLPAGPHRLAVLVRAEPGGEPRLIRTRSFDLPPDSAGQRRDRLLQRAAGIARQRLEQRQRADGSWLTGFTAATQYRAPREELNTYLNAVMIDVAGPVADVPGLQAMLARARGYLATQIEADGLVRYHGRPDAPGIGVLGCAITPDSDDTALVWRIAPVADRALLADALQTMRRYRRDDGLYMTWLAERADYKCLDPGQDPNPADIVIQMHVLMLLAQEDPGEAAALCSALAARAADDAVWVYYAAAPFMAVLRLAELAHAGCRLDLPEARFGTDVPGQQRWMRMAQLLRAFDADEVATRPALVRDATALLQEIAARDFALIASDPPLLYHNDLTATVRRFYWSEDLGYALWLRLDHERRRLGPQHMCDSGDATRECWNE